MELSAIIKKNSKKNDALIFSPFIVKSEYELL